MSSAKKLIESEQESLTSNKPLLQTMCEHLKTMENKVDDVANHQAMIDTKMKEFKIAFKKLERRTERCENFISILNMEEDEEEFSSITIFDARDLEDVRKENRMLQKHLNKAMKKIVRLEEALNKIVKTANDLQ